MALNSSGPISLAGTTVGQSIALELGQSATGQISLNDLAVRELAGVPSGVIVMPINFYGKSAESFWIATLTPTGNANGIGRVFASSTGVYFNINTIGGIIRRGQLTPEGAVLGLGLLPGTATTVAPGNMAANLEGATQNIPQYPTFTDTTNGDIYAAGENLQGVFPRGTGLVKLNSAGTLQWYRRYTYGSNNATIAAPVIRDSAGNLWTMVRRFVSSDSNEQSTGVFLKHSPDGTLLSAAVYGGYANAMGPGGFCTDASNNLAYSANSKRLEFNQSVPVPTFIIKTNSLGTTKIFETTIVPTANDTIASAFDMQAYGSDTLVVATAYTSIQFPSPGFFSKSVYLLRLNSSGGLVWGRRVTAATSDMSPSGIHIDAANNIWWVVAVNEGVPGAPTGFANIIYQIDPNGNLLMQRRIKRTSILDSSTITATLTTVGNAMYVTMAALTSGSSNDIGAIVFRLPTDGSLLGTYSTANGVIQYSVATTNFDSDLSLLSITNTDTRTVGAFSDLQGPFTTPISNGTYTPTVDSLTNLG
jgi:hypothetical protein